MSRVCAVLTFFIAICSSFSILAGDIYRTSPSYLTSSPSFAAGSRFKVFQDGYVFGSASIPVSSKNNDGKIKAGYGVGFEGTVFTAEGFGILTHFSTAYHQVDLTQSQMKGGAFTFWVMPGALYEYIFTDTRTEKISLSGLAMAGVEVYKPLKSINETGSSGSLAIGTGISFRYNYLKIGIRYLYAKQKFDYTIYPNDYTSKIKSSFIQINLGYTFDFYPRRAPH